MPREVVALVSADDLVAAVRVHADRVHDLLRRSGCGEAESVEVCESYALALIDAIVNAPETVGDMAGWWFGRALELGRRLGGSGAASAEAPTASVLAGTSGEAQVRAALAGLPESQRTAVLLRDGYDLPLQAVGVALSRSADDAAEVVAAGRLQLVAAYDDRRPPDLSGHAGRGPADIGTLARLCDGTLPPPRTGPLRRHVANCAACEDVVETMAKGRRLAAGLPIIAMPDEAREAMLERVAQRAHAVLPSVEDVMIAVEEEHDVRPAISPLTVIAAIVLALVLGIALAAITTSRGGVEGSVGPVTPTIDTDSPSFSLSPEPTTTRSHSPKPRQTTAATTSTSPTEVVTSASTSPSATQVAVPASIRLSPTQGPRGTIVTVTGRGWSPGAVVTVQYQATLGGSTSSATADDRGRFSTTVTAGAPLPGSYAVRANGGNDSASATFRQT